MRAVGFTLPLLAPEVHPELWESVQTIHGYRIMTTSRAQEFLGQAWRIMS